MFNRVKIKDVWELIKIYSFSPGILYFIFYIWIGSYMDYVDMTYHNSCDYGKWIVAFKGNIMLGSIFGLIFFIIGKKGLKKVLLKTKNKNTKSLRNIMSIIWISAIITAFLFMFIFFPAFNVHIKNSINCSGTSWIKIFKSVFPYAVFIFISFFILLYIVDYIIQHGFKS